MIARVLVVAGSDSGAGAGIQADLKTIFALGGYATTAITAVTAQDTTGVQQMVGMQPDLVGRQMISVLDDIGADAVKTGMLLNARIVETVSSVLAGHGRSLPLVLDPVMLSTSGTPLLDTEGIAMMSKLLFPRATLLTPNIPEAEILLGRQIASVEQMQLAAATLRLSGAQAVLLKGGHLAGDSIHDVLVTADGVTVYSDQRVAGRHTHGTGCTLASAIAVGLAQKLGIAASVGRARAYTRVGFRVKRSRFRQSENGSRTRIVSSRSGLVESRVSGVWINSSMRRMYLTALAGKSTQERAPRVLSGQPWKVS